MNSNYKKNLLVFFLFESYVPCSLVTIAINNKLLRSEKYGLICGDIDMQFWFQIFQREIYLCRE